MRVEVENVIQQYDREREREERERELIRERDRRDFAMRLRQPWRPLEESIVGGRSEVNEETRYERRSGSVRTMGLAWSVDGKILYVGADDGIYEYHVNTINRRTFPSITFR